MKYLLEAGVLRHADTNAGEPALAQITSKLRNYEKQVQTGNRTLLACIQNEPDSAEFSCACPKSYLLKDADGAVLLRAVPQYVQDADPSAVGWPTFRMPRVDSAVLHLRGNPYRLEMRNSQNYLLTDAQARTLFQLVHRGTVGGWTIEASEDFTPELICGMFIFCRYLELENELVT